MTVNNVVSCNNNNNLVNSSNKRENLTDEEKAKFKAKVKKDDRWGNCG